MANFNVHIQACYNENNQTGGWSLVVTRSNSHHELSNYVGHTTNSSLVRTYIIALRHALELIVSNLKYEYVIVCDNHMVNYLVTQKYSAGELSTNNEERMVIQSIIDLKDKCGDISYLERTDNDRPERLAKTIAESAYKMCLASRMDYGARKKTLLSEYKNESIQQ